MQEQLLSVMQSNHIEPLIGARVPFENAVDAYRLMRHGGQHLGKIVITNCCRRP
jgi:NADPH:quinone reductase-like Zn-dependent oxidoreductase